MLTPPIALQSDAGPGKYPTVRRYFVCHPQCFALYLRESTHPLIRGVVACWPVAYDDLTAHRIIAMWTRLLPLLLVALLLLPTSAEALDPTPYLTAQVAPVGSPTFLRGTNRRIISFIRQCAPSVPGCPSSFDRSSLYYRLPPGITYVSHSSYAPLVPLTCSATAMPDGSQYFACTGGGLSGGMYNVGSLELTVKVANDAPLGTGRLVMGVDASPPDESSTLVECIDDQFPNYCAEMSIPIDVAPAADLFIDQVRHSPLVFQPDDSTSRIAIYIGNRGNAPTTGTHVQTHLPPGFQWNPATTYTSGFAMTCSKTGSWQTDGETVTCSGGALAVGYIDLFLGIRPRDTMEIPGPLPVVVAVNDAPGADPAVLLACAIDSSPAHCAWHEVPTWVACARGRDTGIFCDGFDVQVPIGVTAVPAQQDEPL